MGREESKKQQFLNGIVFNKANSTLRMYFTKTDIDSILRSKGGGSTFADTDRSGNPLNWVDSPSATFELSRNYNVNGINMLTPGDTGAFKCDIVFPKGTSSRHDQALYSMIKEASHNLSTKFGSKKLSLVNDLAYYEYKATSSVKALKPFFEELDNNDNITTLPELHDSLQRKHPDNNLLAGKSNHEHVKSILSLGGNKNKYLTHMLTVLGLSLKGDDAEALKKRARMANYIMGSNTQSVKNYLFSPESTDSSAFESVMKLNSGCL